MNHPTKGVKLFLELEESFTAQTMAESQNKAFLLSAIIITFIRTVDKIKR